MPALHQPAMAGAVWTGLDRLARQRTCARTPVGLTDQNPRHSHRPVTDIAFIEERDEQINVLAMKIIGERLISGVAQAITR